LGLAVKVYRDFEDYEESITSEEESLPGDMFAAAGIFIGTLLGAILWLLMLLGWM
jgi:hypothetical protein